jgi:NADH:ubiquinone oxidoreductase subunit H
VRFKVEANIIYHSINLYYILKVTNHFWFNIMKVFFVFSVFLLLSACSSNPTHLNVSSPDKEIELKFIVNQNGQAGYSIDYKNKTR